MLAAVSTGSANSPNQAAATSIDTRMFITPIRSIDHAPRSLVVFSSLTPHLTGPNTTDAVRKTYILQYAPDGAVKLGGDPFAGGEPARITQDDPDRQYLVVERGVPIA